MRSAIQCFWRLSLMGDGISQIFFRYRHIRFSASVKQLSKPYSVQMNVKVAMENIGLLQKAILCIHTEKKFQELIWKTQEKTIEYERTISSCSCDSTWWLIASAQSLIASDEIQSSEMGDPALECRDFGDLISKTLSSLLPEETLTVNRLTVTTTSIKNILEL